MIGPIATMVIGAGLLADDGSRLILAQAEVEDHRTTVGEEMPRFNANVAAPSEPTVRSRTWVRGFYGPLLGVAPG